MQMEDTEYFKKKTEARISDIVDIRLPLAIYGNSENK